MARPPVDDLHVDVGVRAEREAVEEIVNELGLLGGRCYRLSGQEGLKIPHVGWNSLDITRAAPITKGVPAGSQVYFTHSFVAPVTDDTAAVTEHGEPFAAVVERGKVAGVQFHPEKSGEVGLQILRNWLEC